MKRPYLVVFPGGATRVADFVFMHKDGGACFVDVCWDVPGQHPFHIIDGPIVRTENQWKSCNGTIIRELTEGDREEWHSWQAWLDYKASPEGSSATDELAIEACERDGALIKNIENVEHVKRRLDTKLEAEAAEFLVLGYLLLNRIAAFKAYVNFPGYDLIATDADNNSSSRLQVKSRFRTDWDGFIINNFNCDFVIFVALNRGYVKPKKNGDSGVTPPDFYILPISWVESVRDPKNTWGKITKNRLEGITEYKSRWDLISSHLAKIYDPTREMHLI